MQEGVSGDEAMSTAAPASPRSSSDLGLRPAREMAALLQARAVSAAEVLDAHLAQIAALNPTLNAIVTLDPEGARAQAKAIDAQRTRGDALPPCAGLPIAIKDMEPTRNPWDLTRTCGG
jgi:amidase